jgi:hypothetical protein
MLSADSASLLWHALARLVWDLHLPLNFITEFLFIKCARLSRLLFRFSIQDSVRLYCIHSASSLRCACTAHLCHPSVHQHMLESGDQIAEQTPMVQSPSHHHQSQHSRNGTSPGWEQTLLQLWSLLGFLRPSHTRVARIPTVHTRKKGRILYW